LAEARTNLGELLADEGQLDAALEELQRAVQLAPEDARARQLLQNVRQRVAAPIPKE
jgi:Flp pilus assembly protein TadD